MIIHVVEQGETVDSIARLYGISVERLILENGIRASDNLVVGETLVILIPEIIYTIRDGDTLESIATAHNITIFELLRNNPYLSDRRFIYPGEDIVIKYVGEKTGTITINGYAYPFISMNVLRKTLPFLTYLSIYAYFFDIRGELININDEEIIKTAKDYAVAPIMILRSLADNPLEEIDMIHYLLTNTVVQDRLISNLISLLDRKGYYGVNFTAHYIEPQDRPLYTEFIRKLSTRLRTEGFRVFVTLSYNVFEVSVNVDYEDLHLELLENYVDGITMISYEWGITNVSPSVLAYDTVSNLLKTITSRISPEELNFGISTIDYVWRLPYIEGVTMRQAITYDSAIELARENNARIHYDEVTKASYFQYFSDFEYIVRFRDARGIDATLVLVSQYGINGIGVWNIMYFFDQMWLVINSQYVIEKVLPLRVQYDISTLNTEDFDYGSYYCRYPDVFRYNN